MQGGAPPAPPRPTQRLVQLPGREVNPQRMRLWQELGTNSTLFDVALKASDREVPCNRWAPTAAAAGALEGHANSGARLPSLAPRRRFCCLTSEAAAKLNGATCSCSFILAEESEFFEAKFRSPEFAASGGIVDLTELDGATLQVPWEIRVS